MSEDDILDRWLIGKSESTKIAYRRAINRYMKFRNMTARELLEEADADRHKPIFERGEPEFQLRMFEEYLQSMKGSNCKGQILDFTLSENTIKLSLSAIKSFYSHFGLPLNFKLSRTNTTVIKKIVDTEQVRDIVTNIKLLRDKAITLILFQSGMRISDCLSLKYKQIKEDYEAERIPMKIDAMSIKTNNRYTTFIGKDAFNMLKLYLKDRDLQDEDYLFITTQGNPVKDITFEGYFKESLEKLGLISEKKRPYQTGEITPHSLRSSFSTLLSPHLDSRYIEYFLGHEDRYGGAYFKPSINELREIYAGIEKHLSISVDRRMYERELEQIKQDFYDEYKERERLKEEVERLRIAQEELNEMIIELGEKTINVDENPINRDWIAELRKKTEVGR